MGKRKGRVNGPPGTTQPAETVPDGPWAVQGCQCKPVMLHMNRADRRKWSRLTGEARTMAPAHSDDCPMGGKYSAPGWLAAGRTRSPFRGVS